MKHIQSSNGYSWFNLKSNRVKHEQRGRFGTTPSHVQTFRTNNSKQKTSDEHYIGTRQVHRVRKQDRGIVELEGKGKQGDVNMLKVILYSYLILKKMNERKTDS